MSGFENTLEKAYGGDVLGPSSGSSVYCTTAFTVRQGSVNGMLTAGHCPGFGPPANPGVIAITRYLHEGGTPHLNPVEIDDYEGGLGDFAWFQLANPSHPHAPRFYIAPGLRRRPTGGAEPITDMQISEVVCNFGRATNDAGCGRIAETNYWKILPSSTHGSMVRMDRGTGTVIGDSGGPWWRDNLAFGIHHGNAGSPTPDCTHCDVFTPVETALAYYGLTLRT
jgi:hypothetical protein